MQTERGWWVCQPRALRRPVNPQELGEEQPCGHLGRKLSEPGARSCEAVKVCSLTTGLVALGPAGDCTEVCTGDPTAHGSLWLLAYLLSSLRTPLGSASRVPERHRASTPRFTRGLQRTE